MEVRCECGNTWEVPDETEEATCPECGRSVVVAEADWLSDLAAEDLSLREEEERSEPEPEEPPQPPPSGVPLEEEELELETEAEEPGEAQTGRGAPRQSAGTAAEEAKEATPTSPVERTRERQREAAEAPASPLKRLSQIGELGPAEAVRGFAEPVKRSELIGVAIAVAVLAGFFAVAAGFLANGGQFQVMPAIKSFAQKILEAGAGVGLVLLLIFLVKRDPRQRPDLEGMAEGALVARLLALLVIVPLAAALCVGVATLGGEAGPPGYLTWLAGSGIYYAYLGLVFIGQAICVIPALELGCWGGVIANLIIVFAADSAALTLAGTFFG